MILLRVDMLAEVNCLIKQTLQPIFRQNANPLALGWFALLCFRYPPARAFHFADTNMLALKSLADPTGTPAFALLPCFPLLCLHYAQREPQCEHVEYGHVCIGFTLGMSISFCLFPFFCLHCYPTKTLFLVEYYGL